MVAIQQQGAWTYLETHYKGYLARRTPADQDHLCVGQEAEGRLGETAPVFGPHHDTFFKARCGAIISLIKAGACS